MAAAQRTELALSSYADAIYGHVQVGLGPRYYPNGACKCYETTGVCVGLQHASDRLPALHLFMPTAVAATVTCICSCCV